MGRHGKVFVHCERVVREDGRQARYLSTWQKWVCRVYRLAKGMPVLGWTSTSIIQIHSYAACECVSVYVWARDQRFASTAARQPGCDHRLGIVRSASSPSPGFPALASVSKGIL